MSKERALQIRISTAEFLSFTRQSGEDGIEVRVEEETVWLTQNLMAALFEVTVPTINERIVNILQQGEIDAIIAVGFRVISARTILFRPWASGVLRDFAVSLMGLYGRSAPFHRRSMPVRLAWTDVTF